MSDQNPPVPDQTPPLLQGQPGVNPDPGPPKPVAQIIITALSNGRVLVNFPRDKMMTMHMMGNALMEVAAHQEQKVVAVGAVPAGVKGPPRLVT